MPKRKTPKPLHLACVIDGKADSRELETHRIGGATVTLCRKCYRRLLVGLRIRPAPGLGPARRTGNDWPCAARRSRFAGDIGGIASAVRADADRSCPPRRARRRAGRLSDNRDFEV